MAARQPIAFILQFTNFEIENGENDPMQLCSDRQERYKERDDQDNASNVSYEDWRRKNVVRPVTM